MRGRDEGGRRRDLSKSEWQEGHEHSPAHPESCQWHGGTPRSPVIGHKQKVYQTWQIPFICTEGEHTEVWGYLASLGVDVGESVFPPVLFKWLLLLTLHGLRVVILINTVLEKKSEKSRVRKVIFADLGSYPQIQHRNTKSVKERADTERRRKANAGRDKNWSFKEGGMKGEKRQWQGGETGEKLLQQWKKTII